MVESTKWDFKDIPEDFISNPYTTSLVKDVFDPFFKKLNEFCKNEKFPDKIKESVARAHVIYCMEILVEGYSRVKKVIGSTTLKN